MNQKNANYRNEGMTATETEMTKNDWRPGHTWTCEAEEESNNKLYKASLSSWDRSVAEGKISEIRY